MGLNSRIIEKKVETFLENVLKPETPFNKKIIQRKKFTLLSKLVTDLFDNKNSRVCFNNISNLIVLILNIYNEKFPIDNFSIEDGYSKKEINSKCKDILKQEFLIE
ncbi:MAG: hypothetical protein ACFE9N_13525 [Promethearchaeota archaeon]